MNAITKETFKEADINTKMDILFDYQHNTDANVQKLVDLISKRPTGCEERFKKIETKKIKDTAMASGLGFIGGFTAVVAKMKFWG